MPDLLVYDVKSCKVYHLGTEDKFETLKAAFVNRNAFLEEVLNTSLQPH